MSTTNLSKTRAAIPFASGGPKSGSPDDIWAEDRTSHPTPRHHRRPKLQPIETRLVMLRTGMRAPMGLKIKGESLEQIEAFGLKSKKSSAADRSMASPRQPSMPTASSANPTSKSPRNRDAAARYGLNVADIHETIQTAIGGRIVTTTVEGRERFGVQVRYARETRDHIEALDRILITTDDGAQVPLSEVASIHYQRGPQMIKAEDTYLTGYVTFDCRARLRRSRCRRKCPMTLLNGREQRGELIRPPGLRYAFAGNYQSALEFNRTLWTMIPLALGAIFILLYLNNRSVTTTLIVFSGVAVAWSGGFLLLWLYGHPGFLEVEWFGHNLRELFNISPINLSTAVWVGFLALFGIATDDGVVMSTYLRQRFDELKPQSRDAIHQAVVEAGCRRVRPCLMTTATTMLALLPVLTSTGRGSDLMIPMAVPIFGGMMIALMTMFVVPVLYALKTNLTIRGIVL